MIAFFFIGCSYNHEPLKSDQKQVKSARKERHERALDSTIYAELLWEVQIEHLDDKLEKALCKSWERIGPGISRSFAFYPIAFSDRKFQGLTVKSTGDIIIKSASFGSRQLEALNPLQIPFPDLHADPKSSVNVLLHHTSENKDVNLKISIKPDNSCMQQAIEWTID